MVTQSRSPVEILMAARELISTPEKWTRGELARDAFGLPVPKMSDRAVCFCMSGAVLRAGEGRVDLGAFTQLSAAVSGETVPAWNDAPDRTHAEVLAAFDHAIALAEQSPQDAAE